MKAKKIILRGGIILALGVGWLFTGGVALEIGTAYSVRPSDVEPIPSVKTYIWIGNTLKEIHIPFMFNCFILLRPLHIEISVEDFDSRFSSMEIRRAAVEYGDGTPYFPCYDANGNATECVSASGSTVARYAYDAFGEITAQSGSMADAFPFRFSTKYYETETGILHYEFRPNQPRLGCWMSRDPIEERGGKNLYGFVGNAPINRFDIDGREEGSTIPEILVVVGTEEGGDLLVQVVKATANYEIQKRVAEDALKRAIGKINCRFFQKAYSNSSGYWKVPDGLAQKYTDLLKNKDGGRIPIHATQYTQAALALANGFALLGAEPSMFDELKNALDTYNGDRSQDSCMTVCGAIQKYFGQFSDGNPILKIVDSSFVLKCLDTCLCPDCE